MTAFDAHGDLGLLDPRADRGIQAKSSRAGVHADGVAGAVRSLEPYELLFVAGQRREWAYRVEEGAICVFREGTDGQREVVEFAVQGDTVGLGCLDIHFDSAEAVGCAKVRPVPFDDVHDTAIRDSRMRARLEKAVAREIAARRDAMVAAGQQAPLERVAALLAVISANNRREGREASVVPDALECGVVADLLGMSVPALASHLVELARRGLVEPSACGGLKLLDVAGLEAMAAKI